MADLKRDIRYIDKDFNSFRNALVNYSKTYFPNTYNDFKYPHRSRGFAGRAPMPDLTPGESAARWRQVKIESLPPT